MGLCGSSQAGRIEDFGPSKKSRYKLNTLRRAVKLHEPTSVQELINIFNRNKCFENGYSPLTLAIREGHDEVVEVLIEAGADVNKIDKFGQRPLHAAIRNREEHILTLLLKNGARTDLYDEMGWTPLQRACERPLPVMTKALLDAGANPNDNQNTSPALIKAAMSGSFECLDKLLEAGASANSLDFTGTSAINYAISSNNEFCVRILLEHGADPNAPTGDGVRQAILKGNVNGAILQVLIDSGCHLNATSDDEIPLLIGCVISSNAECLHLLLTSGMDTEVTDKKGKTALYHAAMMLIDTERERFYCNYYSHMYRMHASLDPGVVNRQEATKCLELLLAFNADVSKLWEHLATKIPPTPHFSPDIAFAYELCVKSYGFDKFTPDHYKRVLSLFLNNHSMNLVVLLYKVGMNINDIFEATLEMKSGKMADEIFLWVQNIRRKPRSLLDLTRLKIRRIMNKNVPFLAGELPCPEEMKEFIWLNDI